MNEGLRLQGCNLIYLPTRSHSSEDILLNNAEIEDAEVSQAVSVLYILITISHDIESHKVPATSTTLSRCWGGSCFTGMHYEKDSPEYVRIRIDVGKGRQLLHLPKHGMATWPKTSAIGRGTTIPKGWCNTSTGMFLSARMCQYVPCIPHALAYVINPLCLPQISYAAQSHMHGVRHSLLPVIRSPGKASKWPGTIIPRWQRQSRQTLDLPLLGHTGPLNTQVIGIR